MPTVTYKEQKDLTDSLNFDSNFPWEDASLVKYDSFRSYQGSGAKQSVEDEPIDEAFKSGEFLGWEPVRRRNDIG